MTRALIIEDEPAKACAITKAVETAGVMPINIRVVPDSLGAKETIKTSDPFDVLVLDLHIPKRFGEGTDAAGGPELLRWFVRREKELPEAIIAVTSYEPDSSTSAILDDLGVPHVRYRAGEDRWQRILAGQVKRVINRQAAGRRQPSLSRYPIDFFIQATVDIEFQALSRAFGVKDAGILSGGESWHKVSLSVDDEPRTVVIAQAAQMGMAAAANLATKAIQLWRPRHLFLVGICAGVGGEAELGDIVVPDPAWDYGSGKLSADGILHPDPRPVELRESTRAGLKFHGSNAPFGLWRSEWPAKAPSGVPRLLCRPAASGAAVLADGTTVESIQKTSRKVASVEMEAYGFYFAAAHSGHEPAPRFASLKAVVDFADQEKSDDYQAYGSYIAAKFTRWIVEQEWPSG